MTRRLDNTQRGFTMAELMVTVVIVGVLASVAAVAIDRTAYSRGVKGYAGAAGSMFETARMRAQASGHIQEVEVTTEYLIHSEYSEEGMAATTDAGTFDDIKFVNLPDDIEVFAYSNRAHPDPDDSVPGTKGTGLPATILFYPDGTVTSSTLFIGDDRQQRTYRVTVFGTSGSVMVLEDW